MVSQALVVVVVAAISAFAPEAFSNFNSTGIFATGDHTFMVKPLSTDMSMFVSKAKLTPAKPAFAGTVF